MSRPGKPPFPAAGRVIKGSLLLSDALKLLWLEHVALDRTEGAYIGAGPLGSRLGKGREAIEVGRRELKRLALLVEAARQPGKAGTYFPVLPAPCYPSARPTVAEIGRLSERLDEHIRRIRSGVADHATPTPPDVVKYATLASPVIPLPREIGTQTGVADDAAKSPRVEGGWSTPPSPSTEGGGTPPSLHQGGGPVLTDREKAELEGLLHVPDARLTLQEQLRRDTLLALRFAQARA